MKKFSTSRTPKKKEEEVFEFIARSDAELKRRLGRVVQYLKVNDEKHRWSQNAVIIASLERFIDDIEKDM